MKVHLSEKTRYGGRMQMKTKVVCFSDTHTLHNKVKLPPCDIAIFAGDFTNRGSYDNVTDFLQWYNNQKQCTHKIFIAGNHDISFDPAFNYRTGAEQWLEELLKTYPDLIYLNDSSVMINDLIIYGTPITPWFHGEHWSFNRHRGEDILEHWNKIAQDADVIVSHGPVKGIHDFIPYSNEYVGCDDLARVLKQIRPKLFVCGHIHEGHGVKVEEDIIYVNAAICDHQYRPRNTPIQIEI